MGGNANQRGERLKHVQHPQRGTYKAEQRTATIKQPTALQWAAMNGNARKCKDMNRAHQLINGIAWERKSKIDNGKENQRGTHRREAKQGTAKQTSAERG